MNRRTAIAHVTFRRPFRLANMAEALPAGRYAIETEQETLCQVSLLPFRRIATRIRLDKAGASRLLAIDPDDLEAALAADLRPARAPVAV